MEGVGSRAARMGTSEIYRVVLDVPHVVDALVVDGDGFMPLFVVLRPARS